MCVYNYYELDVHLHGLSNVIPLAGFHLENVLLNTCKMCGLPRFSQFVFFVECTVYTHVHNDEFSKQYLSGILIFLLIRGEAPPCPTPLPPVDETLPYSLGNERNQHTFYTPSEHGPYTCLKE